MTTLTLKAVNLARAIDLDRAAKKLGYIRETTGQFLEIIQARRMEIMELAIIVLFVVDIIVLIFELLK